MVNVIKNMFSVQIPIVINRIQFIFAPVLPEEALLTQFPTFSIVVLF